MSERLLSGCVTLRKMCAVSTGSNIQAVYLIEGFGID